MTSSAGTAGSASRAYVGDFAPTSQGRGVAPPNDTRASTKAPLRPSEGSARAPVATPIPDAPSGRPTDREAHTMNYTPDSAATTNDNESRLMLDRRRRVLLTVEAAAEQLSISRTMMFALLKAGDVASVRVGRLRRVPAAELDVFARRLVAEQNAA